MFQPTVSPSGFVKIRENSWSYLLPGLGNRAGKVKYSTTNFHE
jgi:hypothetical protein